jgi:cystathionine gamma-synthase
VGAAHLVSLLRDTRGVLGAVLDPHAAFLCIRGIKTLALRVERQNGTALALARALEKHPAVERVYYPLLESHPSYAVARTELSGGGGVVCFLVRGGKEAASKVVDGCKLAKIAPSLGGVETLIEQPLIMSYFEASPEDLARFGIEPGLVRLSVGVEEPKDLLEDLLGALEQR